MIQGQDIEGQDMVSKSPRTPGTASATGKKSRATSSPGRATRKPAPPADAPPRATAPKTAAKTAPKTAAKGEVGLKKKELIEAVVARAQVKKKYAKPVVEAMIEILGGAIAKGRDIDLQPMGKIKQQRVKDSDGALVVIARIRQNKPAAKPAASPGDSAPDSGGGARGRKPKLTVAGGGE